MIFCGLKISHSDYKEKIQALPDFFEIIYRDDYKLNEYDKMMKEIIGLKKPFFFHLSTTFSLDEDIYLLNVASPRKYIAKKSILTLEKEVENLNKFDPQGFIVHAPTRFDFSKNRGIIGEKIGEESFLTSLNFLKKLSPRIYIENTPEAILVSKKTYLLNPFDNITSRKHGLKGIFDTGHFFTNCLKLNRTFECSKIEDRYGYFHISTQQTKTMDDRHGKIFTASKKEFPSKQELVKLIKQIKKKSIRKNYYIVCEPAGNSIIHLKNLNLLKNIVRGRNV